MKKNLLIVDDEIEIIELLEAFFETFFTVDTALSAKAAIEKCESNEYQCLITDIFMPDKDGIELYFELIGCKKIESVIFMSGCDFQNSRIG